jgi:hypothetical protein
MSTDEVYFAVITGKPSMVASTLRRRVSAYTRENLGRGFKIGITNDPNARASKYGAAYHEMIVLYKSDSIDSVSEVERDLIDHNEEITKNRIAGGGGNYGAPPYYLYIVIRY